mmetsp:Transcript_31144/g.67255  ORF Transcript_31144/g.67255 Transcript_31144/m.67255 type:complete len:200 (+) Transcript_31144:702-1301(+)
MAVWFGVDRYQEGRVKNEHRPQHLQSDVLVDKHNGNRYQQLAHHDKDLPVVSLLRIPIDHKVENDRCRTTTEQSLFAPGHHDKEEHRDTDAIGEKEANGSWAEEEAIGFGRRVDGQIRLQSLREQADVVLVEVVLLDIENLEDLLGDGGESEVDDNQTHHDAIGQQVLPLLVSASSLGSGEEFMSQVTFLRWQIRFCNA